MRGRTTSAALLCLVSAAGAQPVLTETVEYPRVRPGPGAIHSGVGCFHLASGTITPGDIDWVQVTIPRATTQTVVDVDFPNGTAGSAVLASVSGGTTAFNIADNNNSRDALCGLHALSIPVGSPRDSAANLNATARNVVINIGVTGAEDTGLTGAHSQTFDYDVWVYAATVPCTTNGDCGDGVACTADVCTVSTGLCSNAPDDAQCDNGLFCDGDEFCDGSRGCRPGPVPDCNDGVDCTADDCDEILNRCVNTADDLFCNDDVFCNGVERCDVRLDCQDGPPPSCNDGVACTVDSCDAEFDACVHVEDDARCDDGRFCNGTETCDATRGCQAGSPPNCSDGVACTVDSCDAALDDCVNRPDDAQCDNGLFCDGEETCDARRGCQPGGPPCEDQGCRESDDTCVECQTNAECDDEDFCNGAESCNAAGTCVAGAPPCPPDMTCNPQTRQCEGNDPEGSYTLDLKPRECPNYFNKRDQGEFRVAVVGAAGAEVKRIKPSSLRLSRVDGRGKELSPSKGQGKVVPKVTDVSTPFDGPACGCWVAGKDGHDDLVVSFSMTAMLKALALEKAKDGEVVELRITGLLRDGSRFEATDCLTVRKPARGGDNGF